MKTKLTFGTIQYHLITPSRRYITCEYLNIINKSSFREESTTRNYRGIFKIKKENSSHCTLTLVSDIFVIKLIENFEHLD